ncbi:hypothetical protein J41TS12_50410 [Paenibacillus antibioticophila]|uniref:Uncharacterized protein n=1 Tax=Paenibacillus antibioticophila TaxID=1274374 RepID=A0A920CI05_9BACL|nr:hypothetical protein [Paenibacillus antibioticophila]GIO40180.1 hypothetical protein J41TS12_50410 [Paenibacillus antibioticophila]
MKKNNPLHPFASKKDARMAFDQSAAARVVAQFNFNRRYKRSASEKKAYKPGNIGPSVIATAIKNAYGRILSRRERKQIAERTGQPVQKFYARG